MPASREGCVGAEGRISLPGLGAPEPLVLPLGTRSEFDLHGWSSRDQSDTHCCLIFGPLPRAVTNLGLMAVCDIWEPGWGD